MKLAIWISTATLLTLSTTSFAKSISRCERGYQQSLSSPSIADKVAATETCTQASQKACAKIVKEAGGIEVGDGRYVAAACALIEAYGGNKAANSDQATAECEAAYQKGINSPSTGEAADAIEICNTSSDQLCADDSACALIRAHGAFQEVTKK